MLVSCMIVCLVTKVIVLHDESRVPVHESFFYTDLSSERCACVCASEGMCVSEALGGFFSVTDRNR